MMGIIISAVLIIFGATLFLATITDKIAERRLRIGANVAAIISCILANVVFLISINHNNDIQTSLQLVTNENWNIYVDGNNGSNISTMKPVDNSNKAIEITFNLLSNDWVAICKNLNSKALSNTRNLLLVYKGTGAANTMELKIIDKNGTIFEAVWAGATNTEGEYFYKEISFDQLKCRLGEGNCQEESDVRTLSLIPKDIDRIDFGFSNRPEHGDVPGAVTVEIKLIIMMT